MILKKIVWIEKDADEYGVKSDIKSKPYLKYCFVIKPNGLSYDLWDEDTFIGQFDSVKQAKYYAQHYVSMMISSKIERNGV